MDNALTDSNVELVAEGRRENLIEKTGKWPLASIVILNYNGAKFIDQCLKSVLNTYYPNFEVIFVDNASTDDSVKIAKSFSTDSRLKIIVNSSNVRFAEGNNIGAMHAKCEIIVFLNPDTEVDPNWLKELIKVMTSSQLIGAAQSKLLLTV